MSIHLFSFSKNMRWPGAYFLASVLLFSYAPVSAFVEEDAELAQAEVQPITVEAAPEVGVRDLKKTPAKWFFGDSSLELAMRLRSEMFYGNNLTLLNDCNRNLDKTLVPMKHTFDVGAIYGYGCQKLGHDIVKLKASLRTKGTWGAPETIATTEDMTIKNVEVVMGSHSHVISRNILWIRELWLEATMNEMFGFQEGRWRHSLVLGYFPFLLGRGIALGDAYATDPDLLGYYSPNAIDQYAPGIKFTGEDVCSKQISYDLYIAILNNKSNTFNNVNMNILGQQFAPQDHRNFQQRGFGVINWLFAARVKWTPVNNDYAKAVIEPYVLYDRSKEQKVAFLGDANGKLCTFGLASETSVGNVEFGFDIAKNVGRQKVAGWDSNVINSELRDGFFVAVNSDVIAIDSINNETAGKPALYTTANQAIIDTSLRAQSQNDQVIGANLRNSNDRFNDPYTNHYKGWMMVGDAAYIFFDGLKMCAGGGIATGDENPNKSLDLIDGTLKNVNYKGFISLQELYTGTRIRSAFLLSGVGRIPRLLSFPSPELGAEFPQTVSRFTNIVFAGWSLWVNRKKWNLNTNVLSYWQEHATRIFKTDDDAASGLNNFTAKCAHKWLGVETNVFADYTWFNNVTTYLIASVFIPGTFYKNITGLPLSKAQQKFLDQEDDTGNNVNFVPTVAHDVAYTINMGLEYKF